MNNQVEEVKCKTDIVSLLSEYIDLKKAGRNYKANCPFHGEKTPSFMVSPELQIYKCFGCSESGDVFSFLEKHEGMDFPEALKYLAEKAGVKLVSYASGKTSEREKIIEINHSVLNFYNYYLHNHPQSKKVLQYLKNDRGLDDETINKFQIGFAPDSTDSLFKYLKDKKNYKPTDLQKIGIFVAGYRNFDRFGGRVIFPLMDHRGSVVGFSGRILPWGRQDTAKYINSPETASYSKSKILYGLNFSKSDIRSAKKAIVVEGELDMISCYQAGVGNVVAIKGSALTEEQIRLITRFCSKIILSLDSDFAGDAAARRGAVMAENQGLEVNVAVLKDYKDPDDAARADVEGYKKVLNSAVGIWDFLIDGVFDKYDLSGTGKTKISREVVEVLGLISDKIVQAHYVELVARKLSVPIETVNEQLNKSFKKEDLTKSAFEKIEKLQKPRRQLLEEQLLMLLLNFSPEKFRDKDIFKLFTGSFVTRIVAEVQKIKNLKNLKVRNFFRDLPKELQTKFSELVFVDLKEPEIEVVLKELEILKLRRSLEVLSVEIGKSEKLEDQAQIEKLQKKFALNAKKLSALEEER